MGTNNRWIYCPLNQKNHGLALLNPKLSPPMAQSRTGYWLVAKQQSLTILYLPLEIKGKNPIRIVLDRKLSLNKDLLIFNDDALSVVNDKLSSENDLKVDFDNLAPSLLKELHIKIYNLS